MKTFRTEGIVIKRRNYGEADRILTVFTKHLGKIQVKATGIRRIPSRRSAHVELLNHSILNLYNGRSLPVLTEAQVVSGFSDIKESLIKMGEAYHLCELIDGLCPENQENEKVFYLFQNILSVLEEDQPGDGAFRENVREFEIELLDVLGYYNKQYAVRESFDSRSFIESIMEKKLRSHYIFSELR